MSIELLTIDRLATINEFDYLLLKVLEDDRPMPLYDLSDVCKRFSLNFALSFDNSIKFLKEISVIDSKDDIITRQISKPELQSIQGEYNLCLFLTKRLVSYLLDKGLLGNIFNVRVVHYDIINDAFSIKVNSIPLEYSLIKHFLLNMGIASIDQKSRSRIIISQIYRNFFNTEILQKALDKDAPDIIDVHEVKTKETSISIKSVFISYSHEDELFKEQLVKHLRSMERMGIIKEWHDRKILPGVEWDNEKKSKLRQADIILFLISSDFIASDYIYDVEIREAMLRHRKEEVLIIPVILRSCDFESLPLGKFQPLPANGKPITKWDDRDDAYLDVVKGLKTAINER